MSYPIFVSPENDHSESKHYTCIGWGCDAMRSNWEWYAFEKTDDNGIYFGVIDNYDFETEFGFFDINELKHNNIRFYTDSETLNDILPPVGWSKKENENEE